MENTNFQLFLFTVDTEIIKVASKSSIDGIIVDLENKGKKRRQLGMDTEINAFDYNDLKRVRENTSLYLICRINNLKNASELKNEIETVISIGVDEILFPMARTVEEVENVLTLINARVELSILIETKEAAALSKEFGQLPLIRIYVGLNDLAIDSDHTNIFNSLENGTVDKIRTNIKQPFGFAGLTDPKRGFPIPCHLLISEMARLNCSFTFLRRSFLKDTTLEEFGKISAEIKNTFNEAKLIKEDKREEINQLIQNSKLSLALN